MKKFAMLARLFLGIVFTVFGLNGFFQFIPLPPMNEAQTVYMTALASSGFFFPLLKATEVICGLALLTNQFSALALVVLAPIVIQIFCYQAFLAGGVDQLIFSVLLILASLVVAVANRHAYKPLLRP